MKARAFLISLIAVCVCVHLLRFPHLILENGGGAFLILFVLALNIISFPLLVTERVLDIKLRNIDIRSLISIRKGAQVGLIDRGFIFAWFALRIFILLVLLWFFLYLGSASFVYLVYFMLPTFNSSLVYIDIPTVPEVNFSLLGALFWTLINFLIFFKWDQVFPRLFVRWVLPFVLFLLFVLLVKVLFLVSDFSGLKLLFYPDFLALNSKSLSSIVGHSLVCLFIGLGYYRQHLLPDEDIDITETFARATVQCLALGITIGITALPMIDQISETPFGSNWLFQVLPRWFSYGNFGRYYCGIFFLCLSLLGVFLTISLLAVIDSNAKLLFNLRQSERVRWTVNALFIWGSAAMVVFLQNHLQGWTGQSLMITIDRLVVDYIMPLFALVMIYLMFRYTKEYERKQVFNHQQIFFHNASFFKIWEAVTMLLIPFLILWGWGQRLFL